MYVHVVANDSKHLVAAVIMSFIIGIGIGMSL